MAEQAPCQQPGAPVPDGGSGRQPSLIALPPDVLPGLAGCEEDPAERHIVRSID
ncbi:surface protein [Streptomyces alkaliphilus]|uniref:surface protein n=1 Tax=Streptomyces alkaliphilus TaxID=1472722 RepID=UPI00117C2831|nr:surface protein [Streptomyces alkaliphilus]MQS06049.1 surface protein [Streptomyces alkaliphilus]